jgi:O-antigen ligase
MGGVLGGVFENPNDLAINIALNWPLCFAFLLLADKAWKKALWAGAMFIMAVGVVMTYSRSGFLAIVVCALISLYHFGIKGRRYYLVGLAGAACVVLAIAAPMMGLYPKAWLSRMESTVAGNFQGSFDNGSREARTELLAISLRDMAEHPIIGVGPGNFAAVSGTWRVAHNTYTELGAEGGIPALILFLLILSRAFINLRRVSRSVAFKTDLELKIFAGAMWASCAAYLVGAAFSDTQYELFPYFMVAYTTALYHMACVFPRPPKDALPDPDSNKGSRLRQRLDYGESRKTEVVGSR